ncbi:MAG: YceI family protein [Lysobacteraceae bacterium]
MRLPLSPVPTRTLAALLLAVAAIAAASAAQAQAQRYELDPVHSRIVFSIGHNGYSSALGTFSQPRGTLYLDEDDLAGSRVEVEVDLATLDLGDTGFNQRILKRDFLDASAHPLARFVSNRVEVLDEQRLRVHGVLTLRGVEGPLVLEARLNKLARSRYTLRRTAGFSASARLQRADFGITGHAGSIGAQVDLRIEVEAVRARGVSPDETQ